MRGSGILMHITSLPGPYGVGTMGKQAYRFADFLHKAGQSYWQVLPLTPTGYGDSPYQSCSAYAGNPYLIDLDLLVEQGLLEESEITACNWGDDPKKVDFGLLYENRFTLLRKAYARFRDEEALTRFCSTNESWIPEYAHYMALKDQYGGKPWYEWPEEIKGRDTVNESFRELNKEIKFYLFVQYLFFTQWEKLREYCHSLGISIIGDVPIYVPYDSVEVWAEPHYFCLDETLTPTAVAGCPPDYFSRDGQLWGNPLYNWERHKKDGYRWWLRRLTQASKLYDVIRIDHFRGFAGYYTIPYGAENAREGQWLEGPGMDFLNAVKAALPDTALIAEDLGILTPDVHKLRDDAGLPGMRILEFAFDGDGRNLYLPYNHIKNSVCYTGTHDNMPLAQWFTEAGTETTTRAIDYMGQPKDPVWGMVALCMASVADLSIVQMQDLLGLGKESRMNFPGTCGNNWTWRAKDDFVTEPLAIKIKKLTRICGRGV